MRLRTVPGWSFRPQHSSVLPLAYIHTVVLQVNLGFLRTSKITITSLFYTKHKDYLTVGFFPLRLIYERVQCAYVWMYTSVCIAHARKKHCKLASEQELLCFLHGKGRKENSNGCNDGKKKPTALEPCMESTAPAKEPFDCEGAVRPNAEVQC